jgi:hypothetical protein
VIQEINIKNRLIKHHTSNKIIKIESNKAFNQLSYNFLSDLSKKLLITKYKKYPDIVSFAFWCRKVNLINYKKKFTDNKIRKGVGLVFHITPSNVPIAYAYSLAISLLLGNSNIIKISNNEFSEIKIINSIINKLINLKKYDNIKKTISIISYDNHNVNVTKEISIKSDARIIWGNDTTIDTIKQFPIKTRGVEISFADRYSMSILNADIIANISSQNLKTLVLNFYNDTYIMNQNACTSPHLIIWSGKKIINAKKIFWNALNVFLEEKYKLNYFDSVNKIYNLNKKILDYKKNIKSITRYSNNLYTVDLTDYQYNMHNLRGSNGFFFQLNDNNFKKLVKNITHKYQTLTYFGFTKEYLIKNLIEKINIKGIDRIVPVGKALEMNFLWDGYDLSKNLTRVIDVQ